MSLIPIKNALISVFNKNGLTSIAQTLDKHGVSIYSTGGTETFLKDLDIKVVSIESLTSYPSILGGRVKTLHPKVFGGILARREMKEEGRKKKKERKGRRRKRNDEFKILFI